jgi:hypothetical protein
MNHRNERDMKLTGKKTSIKLVVIIIIKMMADVR